jgi:hypothetical protein
MLKRYLLIFTTLLLINNCFAQDTIEIKRKLTGRVTEVFKALSTDVNTRQGLFKALYKNKAVIATGMYKDDKRVGLWKFSAPDGTILQTYDYMYSRFLYEAPEDTTSQLRYFADKEFKAGDMASKPIKIGGRYYGYLPYLTLFTLPKDLRDINTDDFMAVVELLVSPGGRLADYKVHIILRNTGVVYRTINMNIKLPDPADMVFKPATLNGEPIACRISIRGVITSSGHLDFD